MPTSPLLIASRFGLGVLTWTAIAIQGARHVGAGFPLLNFASYFTVLSNAIAGAVLLIGAYLGMRRHTTPAWFDHLRGAATLYMTVVGLVFVTMLRNVDLGNLLPWINTVHHYVMPVAMIADWVLVPPTHRPTQRHLLRYLVFPLAYITYTLLRGAQLGWYPYPFLDPMIAGGTGGVARNVTGMFVMFVLLGLAVLRIAGRPRTSLRA